MIEHPSRDILSSLVDGECSPDERRVAYEHLAVCADCRRDALEFGAVHNLVSSLPALVAPADFVAGMLATRRSTAIFRDVFRGPRRYVAAAAVCVSVGISLAGVAAPPSKEKPPVDVFMARHVGTADASRVGGQVLLTVHGP